MSFILKPMILGTHRVELTRNEQQLIARWAIKTATLGRYLLSPPPPPLAGRELKWIKDNKHPAAQSGVWLGVYGGEAHMFLQVARSYLEPPPNSYGVAACDAELTVLVMGWMFVLVLQFSDSKQDLAVGTSDNLLDFLVKIWPPPGDNVQLPPKLGISDSGLTKLSSALTNGLIQVFRFDSGPENRTRLHPTGQ